MSMEGFARLTDEKINGKNISTVLNINGDHPLFQGHFPGKPITPGVVLLQLLKEQAVRLFGFDLQIVKASNAKFLAVVVPKEKENEISLETEFRTDNGSFTGISQICHEGKICMKAKLVYKKTVSR